MGQVETTALAPIRWVDGRVRLLDQTRLPHEETWLELGDYRGVVAAIKEMRIRGAPAIGIAGAYALALAAGELSPRGGADFRRRLEDAGRYIEASRPTGANLGWAVRRMLALARSSASPRDAARDLACEAVRIHEEGREADRGIAHLGAALLAAQGNGITVLTHCNAGALATGGLGTALGIIKEAWAAGTLSRVLATETRPLLQGARLTAWELARAGVDVTLVADSAAAELMRRGQVQAVVVGADRVAANGDAANKIGTYALAVAARDNGVPFYVAAPTSTVDMALPSGDGIPIEYRSPEEVTHFAGVPVAAEGVRALNPAFDVTPARCITALITERGVVRGPLGAGLSRLMGALGG